jgi:hypothetical protein
MQFLTSRRLALLAGVALLAVVPARAMMIAPQPIPARVAAADVVVVGKVTAIEEKTVAATQFPGAKDKVEYHIAVVKIQDGLLGAKGLTHIKVGFYVPPTPAPGVPGGPIAIGPRRQLFVKLEVDQEGCLLLNKHHDGDFYTIGYNDLFDKKSQTYEKDLEQVKKAAKLLADPKAGLESKEASDRLMTAGMLIARYRKFVPNGKEEPIDADESKLILKTLADADWPKVVNFQDMSAQRAFGQLGLKPEDGWNPQGVTDYAAASKAWLKDNADKYRIKKFVAEKKEEKKDQK